MSGERAVNIDRFIINLLCCYALFVPLELVLEVFFQIETVFKPYRIFALLIIGCFALRTFFRWTPNRQFDQDIFLYIVFIYGLLITMIRMIQYVFDLGLFYNDTFQTGIYLGVFVVFRHISIERRDVVRIIKFLVLGVFFNAAYVFNNFFILNNYQRDAGLMDNPNYMALGILVAIVFLIIRISNSSGFWKKVAGLALILFLGYIFILAGSRTALAILLACGILMLYYSPVRAKGGLIVVMSVLIGVFAFGGLNVLQQTGPLALVSRVQKESSSDNRLPIWKGVIRGAEATTFTGLGIGQFKARFREFYVGENNDLIRRITEKGYFLSPHSDYLALLVIYGAVGLISYLIFMALSLKRVYLKYRNSLNSKGHIDYQFSFLVLVSIILFGVTNENMISPLFWLLLTLSTRVHFNNEENKDYNYDKHLVSNG
jgi:O-antigen ligase